MISAPNAYNTDKPEHAPEYSFGLKTQIEKPNDVPGESSQVLETSTRMRFEVQFFSSPDHLSALPRTRLAWGDYGGCAIPWLSACVVAR